MPLSRRTYESGCSMPFLKKSELELRKEITLEDLFVQVAQLWRKYGRKSEVYFTNDALTPTPTKVYITPVKAKKKANK